MVSLGELLVKAELLTPEQLDEALETQGRTGSRLGEILVSGRILRRSDLADMLRVQVYETVFRMFAWKEGAFEFTAGEVDYDRGLMQPIRTDHILMDSFRMVDEWPLIKKWVPSFDRIIEKTEAGEKVRRPLRASARDAMDLSEEEWTLLDLASDRPSVQRAIHRSRLGEFETCKALKELQEKGIVRLVQPGEAGPAEARPARRRADRSRLTGLVANAATALALVAVAALLLVGVELAPDPALTDMRAWAAEERATRAAAVHRLEVGRDASSLEALAVAGWLSKRDVEVLRARGITIDGTE